MDLQDPKVQRLLISALVSALMLVGFFATQLAPFTYGARSAQIATLQAEHEKLSREIERARLTVGNMEKVEREFAYLHRQWMVAQKLLPDENEISGLLRRVSAAGTQAGLEWVKFTPQPSLGRGFYRENPVEVQLEGGFHQVGTFLGSLANLGRILNVRGLHLEGVRPTDQGKPEIDHTLTATMQIVAYSIDPSAAMPAAPDAAGAAQEMSAADGASPQVHAAVLEGSVVPQSGGQR